MTSSDRCRGSIPLSSAMFYFFLRKARTMPHDHRYSIIEKTVSPERFTVNQEIKRYGMTFIVTQIKETKKRENGKIVYEIWVKVK